AEGEQSAEPDVLFFQCRQCLDENRGRVVSGTEILNHRAAGPLLLGALLQPQEGNQNGLAHDGADGLAHGGRRGERSHRQSHTHEEKERIVAGERTIRPRHDQSERTLRYFSKSSRIRPAPRTTHVSGSSSTWIGSPVSCASRMSSPRISAPPPVMIMPRSTMSLASSGGVISSARRTASTIACTGSWIASRISLECTRTVFGIPETRSRPFTSISRSSPTGAADPIWILICSAVGSPISRL